MIIYTHLSPDLDACASVWALRHFNAACKEAPVEFKPANWDGSGWSAESGDWIVDMSAGIKGRRDPDGTTHSCFAQLLEGDLLTVTEKEKEALKELREFVDWQDVGNAIRHFAAIVPPENKVVLDAMCLTAVLRAVKIATNSDHKTMDIMGTIFEGMFHDGLKRRELRKRLRDLKIVGSVLIAPYGGPALTDLIFNEGLGQAVVYHSGNNLGIVRAPHLKCRIAAPRLKEAVKLAGEESDWFEHTSGFLYAHGTIKSPAQKPSRLTVEVVAALVNEYLKGEPCL